MRKGRSGRQDPCSPRVPVRQISSAEQHYADGQRGRTFSALGLTAFGFAAAFGLATYVRKGTPGQSAGLGWNVAQLRAR